MSFFSSFESKIKRKLKQRKKEGRSRATRPDASSSGPREPQSLAPAQSRTVPSNAVVSSLRPSAESTPTEPNARLSQTSSPEREPQTENTASPDIWASAYGKFAVREPELARDYKTHLATFTDCDTISQSNTLHPDGARSIVEQLQKQREQKQWHVNFYGKDVRFRAQAEKLVKILGWCNGVVKDALSTQPYAALAWSGVSILLPLLATGTAMHEAMLLGFDATHRVQLYWKTFQDIFPQDLDVGGDRAVHYGLVELYSHIFEYQARVICHLSLAQLSRAWQKVAGDDDWEKRMAHVDMLSEYCKECTDIARREETQRTSDQQLHQLYQSRAALEQIYNVLEEERNQRRNDLEDQRERELLADLAADHESYKNSNPKKVPDTCAWFLENASFRSWRDNVESGLLWVSAGPGCGKSVLSRSLIDEWQLSTSAATSNICYFFFKDGDETREHSFNALSAILHQLFIKDLTGKFTSHALGRHKNYSKGLATNFSELWSILLDCACTTDAGEIVCVLDALDECQEDSRNDIIGKLQDLFSRTGVASRRTCRLKFFVTSRPYDTIERSVRDLLNSSCLRIDGEDHSAAISEDINRVIDFTIPKLIRDFSNYDLRRISERLKAMENRTYLWLRLTFYIIEQGSDYSRPSDVDTLLDDLPSEHAKAYEKILNRVKQSRFTSILLQLMLAATQPLSIDEANYALALAAENSKPTSSSAINLWPKESFKNIAKSYCGLLVDIHDSKLFFIHQTVRAFLLEVPKEAGDWKWGGRFKLPKCHNAMSLACTRYLSLPELEAPLQGNTAEQQSRPFFPYAAQHWPFHYREKDGNESLGDARSLVRLTVNGAQTWTKVHSSYFRAWDWSQWTDLALAAYFGLGSVVRTVIDEGNVDLDAYCGYFGTALQAACAAGFPVVVETLLRKGASVETTGGHYRTSIAAAVQNGHREVVQVLLEKRGDEVEITQDVVVAIAENEQSGKEIMALLLEKRGDEVKITQDVVVAIVENEWNGKEIMALLLEKRGDEVKITQEVMVAIAKNEQSGKEIMALLLENRGDMVKITQEVVIAVAENKRNGKEIMALLLEKRGDEVKITQDVVTAISKNRWSGKQIMALLLEERGDEVEIT
ncbi:hypothetical protein TruAng_005988 [Truncatella angustata]|nr:hypothetical protein TruAng_005988 [Truncatella angustata]